MLSLVAVVPGCQAYAVLGLRDSLLSIGNRRTRSQKVEKCLDFYPDGFAQFLSGWRFRPRMLHPA